MLSGSHICSVLTKACQQTGPLVNEEHVLRLKIQDDSAKDQHQSSRHDKSPPCGASAKCLISRGEEGACEIPVRLSSCCLIYSEHSPCLWTSIALQSTSQKWLLNPCISLIIFCIPLFMKCHWELSISSVLSLLFLPSELFWCVQP